jgi:kumamolisin
VAQTTEVRALVALELRDRAGLEQTVDALYDPRSPSFRRYLTAAQFVDRFAQGQSETDRVTSWLASKRLRVAKVATNRMLVAFSGTAADVDAAFGIELHLYARRSDGNTTGSVVFATPLAPQVPPELAGIARSVVAFTPSSRARELPPEAAGTDIILPADLGRALVPSQVAHAYELDALAGAKNARGEGAKLGIVIGEAFRMNDARQFWRVFGIDRKDPVVVTPLGLPSTRVEEAALDVEWAGALAPAADLVVYSAEDIDERSLLFTFNEAIGRGEVDVLTDSFVHRETTVGPSASEPYETSALMAAAIGMTVVAATGDSGGVDVPAVAPHVTAVGGTALALDGETLHESAWTKSGAGPSRYFARPSWQAAVSPASKGRAVADVALNAEQHYWMIYLGEWEQHGGTSFAAPVFAALVAVIDGHRRQSGRPPVGFLNPILYSDAAVQASFRDVVEGATGSFAASVGWDHASGWGAPRGTALADSIP